MKKNKTSKQLNAVSHLNKSPVHLLHRIEQYASDVFLEEMKETSLTPRQFAVLLTISEYEGLSQTGLVDQTGIDRSTLADIIRRMLKKGLVSRKRTKDDARAYSVNLTVKGKEALSIAVPASLSADDKILKTLPDSDREDFLKLLTAAVQAIVTLSQKDKLSKKKHK